MSEELTETPPVAPVIARRRRRALRLFLGLMVALVLLVGLVGVATRFIVLSPQALMLIEARTTGLKLGRIGELTIEGITGDIWTDFNIRRLTITDEEGVWLEARNIHVDWDYWQLFRRRLSAELIEAEKVDVYRRPIMTPKTRDSDLPVSFDIDRLAAQVETHPALSIERGLFDLVADFEVVRRGGGAGALVAESRLHEGDRLQAKFSYGRGRDLLVDADAVEAEGGAIAGLLGLPADRPFSLDVLIGGENGSGDIRMIARTGDDTPLEVTGGWSAAGLQAQGRLDITASSLIAAQAERFGSEFTFEAAADPGAEDGVYDLQLDASAENLAFTAVGPVDVNARATPGLAVTASVGDLSRVTPEPRIGPARFDGRLIGSLADFTLAGNLSADGFGLAGFEAGRVAGTGSVERDGRNWNIAADLAATGGRGDTILAGLLGASPTASVEMTRFEDGRLLMRALALDGDGLVVTGRGTHIPVVNRLSFEGSLRTSNLAVVRPGASGVVTASWSAASAGRGRPWAFTADARGADFSTGMAQLDRLLGPDPRLDARVEMASSGVWTITRSRLNGEAGEASATGTFGPQNALALDVDWEAAGPFQAGPVEISGRIAGDGRVTGTLAEPRAELVAQIGGIDVGALSLDNANLNLTFAQGADGSNGAIRLAAASAQGPATARAAFRFTEAGVDLSGIDANAGGVTAVGALSLRNGQPSRADLTLNARAGAFLAAGQAQARVQIVDAPGGARADITLRATEVQFPNNPIVIRTATLTAQGPMDRLPYTLRADAVRGDIPVTVNGSGIARELGDGYNLTFAGDGRVNTVALATIEPLNVNFGGEVQSVEGLLSVGGGRARIVGRQQGEDLRLQAEMTGVDFEVISQDLDGQFDATLTATGRGASLTGDLNAQLQDLRSRDGSMDSAIDGVFEAQLRGNRLTAHVTASNQAGLQSVANVVLPAEASASPFRVAINRTRPMSGDFNVDGELRPIWDLFFGGARTLGGRLRAQGTLAGTLNDPQVTGTGSLTDGTFEDFASGLKLRDVALDAVLQRDSINVTRFTGRDERSGSLNGQGNINLAGGPSSFSLVANRFLLIDNEQAEASASGEATITRGADGRATLVGALTIDRADIIADPPTPSNVVPLRVVEINVPPERANYFDPPQGRGPSIALDVSLNAPRRIFVRGRGLDVEMSLDARVRGTTSRPELSGVARVVRGEYEFAGKRFEFDTTGVVYLSTSPENIRLDLTATRDDPSLTAIIQVDGTAARPEISLTSSPALPNDEILSQVLFGRSASQLSAVEAAQLASSIGALASGGGFDVIGGLRDLAGLDRLTFGGGDASGLSVSGGKYLSDDVYLELTGGGREGGAAQVEWRVRRNLSVVSRVSGDGDTRLSIRWRREFNDDDDE